MSFPTTPILDDFNRASGALGANWLSSALGGDAAQVAAVGFMGGEVGSGAAGVWTAPFAANQEVWATFSSVCIGHELFARVASAAGNYSGYGMYGQGSSGQDVLIRRHDNKVATQLGAAVRPGMSSLGDMLGIEVVGTTITCYISPASAPGWVAFANRSDATYNRAGQVGIKHRFSPNYFITDFGGGEYVPPPPPPVIPKPFARPQVRSAPHEGPPGILQAQAAAFQAQRQATMKSQAAEDRQLSAVAKARKAHKARAANPEAAEDAAVAKRVRNKIAKRGQKPRAR